MSIVSELAVHMVRARTSNLIHLTAEHRATLERWVRGRTTPQRLVLRSRIVLLAATGLSQASIAERLGTTRQTVRLWCRRFTPGGPAALQSDAPGRGRKPGVSVAAVAKALTDTGAALSVRQLAQRFGVSPSAVQRAVAAARRTKGQFRNGD